MCIRDRVYAAGATFKHPEFKEAGDDETGVAMYRCENGALGFVHVGRTAAVSYTHLDVYKRQTYDNEYKDMMMDIRVYRMKAGETRSFKRDGEELAVLLLSGNITYAWDGNKETVSRKDVFTEGPWCVHVCTGTEVSVTAEADSEILVQ